jgi:heme exporter protein C
MFLPLKPSQINYWFPRICWWSLAIAVVLSFVASSYIYHAPDDYLQGVYAKIMYIHIPLAWYSLFCYSLIGGFSIAFLVTKNPMHDLYAQALVGIGATFTLATLLTGSIWGKPTWGTWWVWDARLTSMLILLFIYLGYIALRALKLDSLKKANICAVFAIIGLINIPIIKFSVEIWHTLHQPSSVLKLSGPSIHHSMLKPLCFSVMAFLFWLSHMFCLNVLLTLQAAKLKKL